jgi:hypothetical protein
MATLRFRRVSRARYTSPMPGASAGGTISYRPSFVPEATVIGARNYSPVRRAAVDATTLATKRPTVHSGLPVRTKPLARRTLPRV